MADRPLPQDQVDTVICRISQAGTITLPIIGQVYVTGKTLSQIESIVAMAYYPIYARTYPTVLVTLRQASSHNVSIVGAVARPGVYELRSDQMSLLSLLMEAGGIVQSGAMCIRIVKAEADSKSKTIVLPIKGLNIPFSDVALQDGNV